MKPKFIALITVLILLLFSIEGFSQKDSTKKIPDSSYYIADTTIFKVPARLIVTLRAIINNEDYSHKQYLEIKNYFEEQIEKQAVKRPKK